MKSANLRRLFGLSAGLILVILGSLEILISQSDLEMQPVKSFCDLGFCASQFSPERVFALSQKAALGNPQGELDDFRTGVKLSPASAYRWADLADAEFKIQDEAKARHAMDQALQAGPHSAIILERAANLYFQIGDQDQVIRQLHALLSDPSLYEHYETAFLTYSRLGLSVDQLLRRGVPQNREVLSRFLQFWTKLGKTDAAIATWKWMFDKLPVNNAGVADGQSTAEFFEYLLSKPGTQQQAQDLWAQYAVRRFPEYRKSNYIYNPRFAHEPERSPFDWRINQRPEVAVEHTTEGLRLSFNGLSNLVYGHTSQDVVLAPGVYKLSVMMKTSQVTTDEGIRIHLFDVPNQKSVNVWTDTVTGTSDWKRIDKTFNVQSGETLVRVMIARQNSIMADNKIGGAVWINNFQLARQ